MKQIATIFGFLLFFADLLSQDIIYTKNQTKIECDVKKISDSEIEYLKFDKLDGPIRVISTSKVHQIVYEDGSFEMFSIANKERKKLADEINTYDNPVVQSESTKIQESTPKDSAVSQIERLKNSKPDSLELEIENSSSVSYVVTRNPKTDNNDLELANDDLRIANEDVKIYISEGRADPYSIGKAHNAISFIPFKYNRKDKKNVIFPTVDSFLKESFQKIGISESNTDAKYILEAKLTDYYYESYDGFTVKIYQRLAIIYTVSNAASNAELFKEEIIADHKIPAKEYRQQKKLGESYLFYILSKNVNTLFENEKFGRYISLHKND